MGLSTFIGGVHPYEGKELSADKPIQVIQPKGELVYPLVFFFRDAEADCGVSPPAFSVQALNAHGLLLLRS